MHLIRLAAGVVNQTPLDWRGNRANILACIREAREQRVSILCLPELCISGYGCEDAFLAPDVHVRSMAMLESLLPETHGMVVSVGLPVFYRNAIFNCAALMADGQLLGFAAKRFLPGDGIHYEPRWFKPWTSATRGEVLVGERTVPIGDVYFEVGGVRIGFEICEDAWVGTRPGASLASKGVDVILNPSASHFAFGKQRIRERLVLEGSRAFAVSYVYTNLLGNEAGRVVYDGGAMIASGGAVVARSERFLFAKHHVTSVVVDVDATRMAQAKSASFEPQLGGEPDQAVSAELTFAPCVLDAHKVRPDAYLDRPDAKEEEFSRAVMLGLFDYMRKSRSAGFVVSLSGGCDSATVAALSAYCLRAAWSELGRDEMLARLCYLHDLSPETDVNALVAKLLTCVYQATRNSSMVTHDAARDVAMAIGATFYSINVDAMVEGYTNMASQAIGRPLEWSRDDLALQNIQARVRGPSVWMLANLKGALLLATSNRSEAAVGYATMDGDTCGGLSPITGIDKAYLRKYLVWLEQQGPSGLGPISALHAVNVQAPTAELRPSDQNQTDEADLMPYEILDRIERAAVRDKLAPIEVFRTLLAAQTQYTPNDLRRWVDRFFRLWCRNQWKRERYAPSFHLDDENLDPKTWCRFPILSSGYEEELDELHAYVVTALA